MKIIVKKEDELLNYLYNNLDMPKKRIKQYLVHGSIYVNNNRTTKYNTKVLPGMNILIDTLNSKVKELPFKIIYEDDNIIVINKPSNLLTNSKLGDKDRTLYKIVKDYLISKDKNTKLYLIYGLDRETSGIVLFSKNEKTKNKLLENWKDIVKLNEFTAIVSNKLESSEGRLINYIKQSKSNMMYLSRNREGMKSIINYKVIKENSNYSMLSIKLESSIKDEIRVVFNVVGDNKYSKKNKENRLYLHCNRLKIYYYVLNKEILFETGIDNEFKKKMKEY